MHVPGWHEATKDLQSQGKLQMIGIIQEQHPDRARLFMQWKEMGWPVLIDPLNLLNVPVVPLTLGIDEHGIIRIIQPSLQKSHTLSSNFIDRIYGASPGPLPAPAERPELRLLRQRTRRGGAAAWRDYADALALWGSQEQLGKAIEAYENALRIEPDHAPTRFRLGVAFRMRYDSVHRQDGDFGRAVLHWTSALDVDPNNYIWRRRIQQYGPRLDKPYPFYDWIPEARREILGRGERPVELRVQPGGAEFAKPLISFEAADPVREEPDRQRKVLKDQGEFVNLETTVVPPLLSPGSSARVHVVLRPNLKRKAHWNNEVDDLELWMQPPSGWLVDNRRLTYPNPAETVSQEIRKLEFEVRSPVDAGPGIVSIPAYALYYVCEDVNGTCLYRRKDIVVPLQVR